MHSRWRGDAYFDGPANSAGGRWAMKAMTSSKLTRDRVVGAVTPVRLAVAFAVLMALGIVVGTGVFVLDLRHRTIAEASNRLSSMALIIAKQFEERFATIEQVQKDIADQQIIKSLLETGEAGTLPAHDLHLRLRDKAAGMPFVGSLILINRQGR